MKKLEKREKKLIKILKKFLQIYQDDIEDFIGLFESLDEGGKVF